MFKRYGESGDVYVATGQDAVQLTFEKRGIELYLSPGQANGLGELLQRAACSVGAHPIGGDRDHERFILELERIYQQFHVEQGT